MILLGFFGLNLAWGASFVTPPTPYTQDTLQFYSTNDAYGEFSNFAAFPIFLNDEWWPTSEHYFQAHKYTDPDLIKWVQSAPTAFEAAQRGRDQTVPKRADWVQVKEGFMRQAVTDKFRRYTRLAELLLSTGQAHLIEHTKNDCEWADCGDGTGQNKLGLLLESVRDSLPAEIPISNYRVH